jgi:type II pantothenate kinase
VILCANSKAAINDITHAELLLVLKKACQLNETVNEAYTVSKRLVLMESGSTSPCLDLTRINISLAKMLAASGVDLFVLEGMGRAIHTNFDARFKCDCLKAAVIKNEWLANRFGFFKDPSVIAGEHKFPVIFKYEKVDAVAPSNSST